MGAAAGCPWKCFQCGKGFVELQVPTGMSRGKGFEWCSVLGSICRIISVQIAWPGEGEEEEEEED